MRSLRELRQEQLEDELQDLDELFEKLNPSDPTGKWIHDFVHSDNPKFADKSKKERIRMALGAKYGAMRKMKEEAEDLDEVVMSSMVQHGMKSHQAKTTLKHIKPGTMRQNYGDKQDAAHIKPGIKGVADRLAMLNRAKAEGRLKEDVWMAEAGMPSSVIKSKQRYSQMSPAEFAKAHGDKSDDILRGMAWRHGYGKNSNHYVNKRNEGMKTEEQE